jgi:DNA-binding CsgD family transcriptional regulator
MSPQDAPAGVDTPVGRTARRRLSPRQLEVLRLTEKGLTLEEIAERLAITPRTAKAHSDEARKRLGVPTRRRMAAAGRRYKDVRLEHDPLAPSVARPAPNVASFELSLVERTVLLSAIAEVKAADPSRTAKLVLNRLERFVRGLEVSSVS